MSEKDSVEGRATRIDNCFDDTGFDVTILASNCVAGMVIWDESNDHIGCRVLLRWSGYDCSDLLRYFGWGDKFESGHIGGRMMESGVETHSDGIESGSRELVGLIAE